MAAERRLGIAGGRGPRVAARGARVGGILAPLLLALAPALAGCAAPSFILGPGAQADRIARAAGWNAAEYPAGQFQLRAYERFDRPGDDLAIYIESDGLSYLNRTTQSADPTPARPLVLRLAVADPSPNRLYLARPCQYLDAERRRACAPEYWSIARFAPEVIDGYMAALELAKRRSGAERLTLVGYSGGGTVAALLAARRADVVRLVTVAGTLDHESWTRGGDVTPLSRSLNPVDFTERLRALPQIHFVGARDRVVPPSVTQSYIDRLGTARRARLVTLPDYDHECCWEGGWRGLLREYVYPAPPA